jgi:hypothetical protein
MGYRARGKLYRLKFEDKPELDVRTAGVSLKQMFEVADQADRARAGAGLAEITDLVELFGSRLRFWNVIDEDDKDIPANAEGFWSLDSDDALAILLAWYEAMTGQVPDGLGKDSISGAPSLEASIPMDVS